MANTLKFGTDGNWAVKKDSVLAYNDENSNFKPLPFDFTRDSTATYVDSDGLIKTASNNEARIDYLGNTNGHLLLEPSRTNLITYSENIPQLFVETSLTDTFEYGTAPDGTQKSTRIQLTALGTSRYVSTLTGIVASGVTYTFSCYYKGTKGETAYMNALPVGGTSVDKEIVFTGEWQRENVTFTAGSSSNYAYIVDSREGGDATDFEVWGAQVESGSYATSYIPTSGSSVTRAADTANGAGNSEVFNDSEGVLFVDISALANDSTNRLICINDGSSSNRVLIKLDDSSNVLNATAGSGSVGVTLSDETIFNKIALKYKVNDIELWVNGFLVDTDTTATMPTGLSEIDFDKSDGTNDFYGKTKEIRYFNTALTDAELEYETSYRSLSEMVTELNLNTL